MLWALLHPVAPRQFAMIPVPEDVRQPDCGCPAPTQSMLQPIPPQWPIIWNRQLHWLHEGQEEHEIIAALCRNREVFFHTLQYATTFHFCLSPYTNGKLNLI